MADRDRLVVLTDAQWAALEPLIEACRPRGKTPHHDLRRTLEAIIWRHENGAKWRSIPPELGPWWMAAQTFNRWGHLGVWERLLEAAQAGGGALGMAFLGGSNIRAPPKAAGGGPQSAAPAERGGPEAAGPPRGRLGAQARVGGEG